ncbi:N-acetyltransferase [Romeria aff. gracilis LEGE 07310]|uniref:N-acetyltransferase n=1 Tax=Vasconcelosia minhoensis LEGE 07310 TaxID=915328 RepID=A0A8J7A537_9CYAN|nr:N-acetyltransferase [Romeria gracilis]MBE9076105.1 N-acetyltransferase [Romeria aff. gracilis LEGE 07310]
MISVRAETSNDYDAVRHVIVDAFTPSEFGHHGEADLVEQLRDRCDCLLSLVAVEDSGVIGHILFSPVSVRNGRDMSWGMGLAPLAIAPHRQRQGIGTALVKAGLVQLAEEGCPFVVVLGHGQFYSRFGFEPAAQYGLSHGFAGIPQSAFWVNRLVQESPVTNGRIFYRPEFGLQADSA